MPDTTSRAGRPLSPIRPTDDAARALGRTLMTDARYGALAVLDPETGHPLISRIAVGRAPDGGMVALVSDLAQHTAALHADPRASLLLGEPGPKGDPLNHPRLSHRVIAAFVARDSAEHGLIRARYLAEHPKAKLYVDFADFSFVRFRVEAAALNGGFGKAYDLLGIDLE